MRRSRCLSCLTSLSRARHAHQDADYAIEIAKVNVPLKGGLGLGLEELRRGRDGPWCTYLPTYVIDAVETCVSACRALDRTNPIAYTQHNTTPHHNIAIIEI